MLRLFFSLPFSLSFFLFLSSLRAHEFDPYEKIYVTHWSDTMSAFTFTYRTHSHTHTRQLGCTVFYKCGRIGVRVRFFSPVTCSSSANFDDRWGEAKRSAHTHTQTLGHEETARETVRTGEIHKRWSERGRKTMQRLLKPADEKLPWPTEINHFCSQSAAHFWQDNANSVAWRTVQQKCDRMTHKNRPVSAWTQMTQSIYSI